jgi:tetratricopeptide (TPR) repeat protein
MGNTENITSNEQYKQIDELILAEKWEEAQTLIYDILSSEPDDHWLLAELAETYYEERKYKKALTIIEKALVLSPHCPLVLWYYTGILEMNGRIEEAIKVYKTIIHRGVRRIADGECGEGIRWARRLIGDSNYKPGSAYAMIGDFKNAEKYIKKHIIYRNRNFPSNYKLRTAKHDLQMIINHKDPRSPEWNDDIVEP